MTDWTRRIRAKPTVAYDSLPSIAETKKTATWGWAKNARRRPRPLGVDMEEPQRSKEKDASGADGTGSAAYPRREVMRAPYLTDTPGLPAAGRTAPERRFWTATKGT